MHSEALAGDSVFAVDTRVTALGTGRYGGAGRNGGDGRYGGEVTDRWNGLRGNPLGGYVLAIALRALSQEVSHHQISQISQDSHLQADGQQAGGPSRTPDPLVVSAFFLEPVTVGPVELHASVLRSSRRTATGAVRLLQHGREALRATATFTDLAVRAANGGPTVVVGHPPDLPAPEDSVDLHTGGAPPAATVTDRLSFRVPRIPGWREGTPSGHPTALYWLRLTEGGQADSLVLPFLVDSAPPAIMDLGAIGSTTLELTLYAHRRPTTGWLACRATTRFLIDGYHEEDFEIWDGDGILIAQSRQLGLMRR